LIKNGREITTHNEILEIENDDVGIRVKINIETFDTKYLVNCAGLYSDKLAKLSGVKTDVKIIPFRGEYFKLSENTEKYVKTLIYPVPNPELPFLGVHFTNIDRKSTR